MPDPEVYALDLDEELLSHLAIPESVDELWAEDLDEALIEDPFVLKAYQWQFAHLHEHGRPATPSVLADEFDIDLSEPLTAVGDLAERLRDRYMKNHAREHMEKISDAYKEDPAKVIQVLPEVAREIVEIAGKKGDSYGTGDYDRAMAKYDKSTLRGPGPSLGFPDVDNHFHGARGVVFTIAPPKTYKSWIGVNSLVQNVLNGVPTELESLELPADETDFRVRCLAAGIPPWRYLRGSLSQEDRKMLKQVSEYMDDMGHYRCVKPAPGHRSIEEMVERAADRGAEYIIIDQLQYVETSNGKQLGASETRDYWGPLNKARDLSDDIPMMILHQFNRSVMGADKMPEMQQAKGSAAIEEIATLALGLWANKDMRRSNVVELGTLASRHYQFQSWEIGVELSRGCNFECLGRVEHDDE